jgi:hypothetical protein
MPPDGASAPSDGDSAPPDGGGAPETAPAEPTPHDAPTMGAEPTPSVVPTSSTKPILSPRPVSSAEPASIAEPTRIAQLGTEPDPIVELGQTPTAVASTPLPADAAAHSVTGAVAPAPGGVGELNGIEPPNPPDRASKQGASSDELKSSSAVVNLPSEVPGAAAEEAAAEAAEGAGVAVLSQLISELCFAIFSNPIDSGRSRACARAWDGYIHLCQEAAPPLEQAQALVVQFLHGSRAQCQHALEHAIAGGHLAIVQWLTGIPHIITAADRPDALRLACLHGQCAIADWLADTLPPRRIEFGGYYMPALKAACVNNNREMVQWMVTRLKMPSDLFADDECDLSAFRTACAHGSLEIAQWVADYFHLHWRQVRAHNDAALRAACTNGHLAVAEWLVDTFAYARDTIRGNQNCLFRLACAHGQREVAQWLTRRFQLDVADVNDCAGSALRRACAGAHVATVRWLAPQCMDPAIRWRALRAARKQGHGVVICQLLNCAPAAGGCAPGADRPALLQRHHP